MIFAHRSFLVAHGFLATLLSTTHAAAVPVQKNALQSWDQVNDCKAVLLAFKATSFCSSFNGVRDTTTTVTSTSFEVQVTTTTTITLSTPTSTRLTTLLPALTTVTETSTAESTTTTTTTVTSEPAARVRRGVYTSQEHQIQDQGAKKRTSTSTTKASSCTIKGLSAQATAFVCDVVSEACSLLVHPTTYKTTTTTTLSTDMSTVTSTVTPIATTMTNTVTPPADLTTTTTATTITVISTSTTTVTPPAPPVQYPQCEDVDDDGYGFAYICNSVCIPNTDAPIVQTTTFGRFPDCVYFCWNASVNVLAGGDCEANGDPCPDPQAILLTQYTEATGTCVCYDTRGATAVVTDETTVGQDCAVPRQ